MLKGKTVLITGGTGHIGSQICRVCKENGANVLFSYNRNAEKAKKFAEEIQGFAFEMNLEKPADIEQKINSLYKQFPQIDVLINNAAISQILPLAMLDESDVDQVINVNIKGTIFVTKAVIRGMIRNNKGTIVNMGSIAGNRMLDVPVMYAVTKAAINGLTFSLATELKRFNIRVNSVVPGLIDGGVANGVPDALREDFIKHCAMKRAGTAREVAELVCFLASDKSSYINGQNIAIDGGI